MSYPKFDQQRFCDICGLHRGRGFDHAKCSRQRQELHATQPTKPKRKADLRKESSIKHFTRLL